MQFSIAHLWDNIRSSFWFVPLGMMLLAAFLGLGIVWLDDQVEIPEDGPFGWLLVNAATARSTLTLLAQAMITLSGVVFSMTMVTLSLTSNQFGSRLLRTAMTDFTTQAALGAFLSAALYSLVVMRFIPLDADSPFVPDMAVFFAGVLTFLSLVMMIWFVHHISVSIQAQNVVAEVAVELDDAIERIFPEEVGTGSPQRVTTLPPEQPELGSREGDGSKINFKATREGYLQAIDVETLMSFACKQDLILELLYRPGDFVIKGTPLARVVNPRANLSEAEEKQFTRQLNAAILTGRRRTPRQDLCCAVNEMVEVAVRALSPGINDPFTAVSCIDQMTAVLTRLLGRKLPSAHHYDDDENLRIIVRPVEVPYVIETAYRQIVQYGATDFSVVLRLMEGLDQLMENARRDADRSAIRDQARRLYRKVEHTFQEPRDQERLKALLDRICGTPSDGDS